MAEPTRWYVPAYRAANGSVQRMGTATVLREYAEKEAQQMRDNESDYPDGDPDSIFVATRLEYPWEEAS